MDATKSATEGSATEPIPTPLETAQGASNGLLTESAFAQVSPSAVIAQKMDLAAQNGSYDPSKPESINGFEEFQKAKGEEFFAGLQASLNEINYGMDENGNFIPLGESTPDNLTAANFKVTDERTLGRTEAFNPSPDAYSTLIAAEEAEEEASKAKA